MLEGCRSKVDGAAEYRHGSPALGGGGLLLSRPQQSEEAKISGE